MGIGIARVVVIGNSGGGKSTLARRLAARRGLRHVEIDRLLWQDGWVPAPAEVYADRHRDHIAQDGWVIDGLGRRDSIPSRIARATEIVLIDLPLWIHFRLAAERQIAWATGTLDHPPAGVKTMPPTEALFRTIWEVDRDWMPEIRERVSEAERNGVAVTRIADLPGLDAASCLHRGHAG